MSIYSTLAKNRMLDALDESNTTGITTLALYTAYSSTGAANEVSGGSPAYARKAATFNAAASGSKALASSVVFDVPASTVRWIGMWDTAGPAFLGMVPAGGGNLIPFVTDDTSADLLESVAHGFSNGDAVVVWAGSNTLPTDGGSNFVEGTVYFVVSSLTDSLQLAATSGGSAINITTKGEGFLQKIVPEVFAAQGSYTVSSLTLSLGVS